MASEARDGVEIQMEMPEIVPIWRTRVSKEPPILPELRDFWFRSENLLPECCRVPTTFRHLKEEAYTPKVVSIGPLHHGNERLQDMERHKHIVFNRFTRRASLSRDDLVCFVELHLVSKTCIFYPETIRLIDTPKLVDMILLDAGFIIELFLCLEMKDDNDAVLSQPWLKDSIMHDLLLLENQLPFVIIEDLFKRAFPGSHTSFLELTYEYFGYYNRQKLKPNPDDIVRIKHFTDLLRLFYLLDEMPQRRQPLEDGSHILLYNANALQEAGVKLRANHESKFLLDLKFLGHVLEIPQIVVEENTELLFCNMIALEQCHYPYSAYITDYALLLHWLIDTHKDVDLLIRKNIVRNYLGNTNNVASLINGLSDNVVQVTFSSNFVNICKRLNEYCEDRPIPWRTMASFAGTILLILTIIQTIFSVLQVEVVVRFKAYYIFILIVPHHQNNVPFVIIINLLYITDYVLVLDYLIDTLKDVDIYIYIYPHSQELEVRISYPETIKLTDTTKFIDLILLDAAGIIELFIMSYNNEMKERVNSNAKLVQPWLANSIHLD